MSDNHAPIFGVSKAKIGVYRDGQLFDVRDIDPTDNAVELTPSTDGKENPLFMLTPGSFTMEFKIYPAGNFGAVVTARVYFGATREQQIKNYVRSLKNKLRGGSVVNAFDRDDWARSIHDLEVGGVIERLGVRVARFDKRVYGVLVDGEFRRISSKQGTTVTLCRRVISAVKRAA